MNCGYVIELLDLKGEKNTRMLKKKKHLGNPFDEAFCLPFPSFHLNIIQFLDFMKWI